MNMIFSSKRYHHLAKACTFLIMVALITGMVGCGTTTQYTLSIYSTSGGNVTHPSIGTFVYPAGAVVLLEAMPADGYSFVNWSGNVSTIDNVTAATTTITMNGNYFIIASFVQGEPIRTWYNLAAINNNLGGNYTLVNDLDSNTAGYTELASPTANEGKGWDPIGGDTGFYGTFDGQGYKIKDLFINHPDPDESTLGLFGYVGEGNIWPPPEMGEGVVKNVGLVDITVTGGTFVGGLTGGNVGTVSNCYATGNVTGTWLGVGGLMGINFGNVSDCWFTGSVTGVLVGGLLGLNAGNVSNCYATGNVTGIFKDTGGLLGANYGPNLCLCPTQALCLPGDYIGILSRSYAISNVTGDSCVGGLMGANGGPVTNCYSTGSLTGNSSVGGLVGFNVDNVTNCYSMGSVTGNYSVGGLVGANSCDSFNGTVTNSFWDIETSGEATSDGGTGKDTTEMRDISTFTGATWNITAVANPSIRNLAYIWNIVDDVTYPFLSWQL